MLAITPLLGCATSSVIDGSRFPTQIEQLEQDKTDQIFRIGGSVNHPGSYSLKSDQTIKLSEALQKAGGTIPGTSADNGAYLTKVTVLRLENKKEITFKLDVSQHGTDGNFLIKSGDQIFVPEVFF